MRGLCGWFGGDPHADARAVLGAMLATQGADAASAQVHVGEGFAFASFGESARPALIDTGGHVLLASGHPRLRSTSGPAGTVDAVARELQSRGAAALPQVGGDFAIASWDTQRRRGVLAVDRVGAQPLVYHARGGLLVFASSLDMVAAYPGVPRELSPQAVYDYLFYHVCPGPQTILRGLFRVPAGQCIEFEAGRGAAEPKPYWTLRFEERDAPELAKREEEFLELLRAAVGEAAEGARTGSFLSGGTDSSTVSGMLGKVSGAKAQTFSIGFDATGYDESEYARIAVRHFDTEHHEYYVTPKDVVDAVPRIAASYDQPFGNASAIPTYYCAKLARENGMTRLLAGDGGDELFGGNERYGKQYLLSLYENVPGFLKGGLIEPLLMNLPGIQAVPPLRKLRSYVEQARPPMPHRYESYNLLQHLGPENVLLPEYLGGIDTGHPRVLMEQTHAGHANDSLVNQMLGIDMRFILADGDLPKVGHMCNLAGMDVAYPLLDDRLIEFSAHLPADWKLRGTKLRWFFKHALRNFLPPEIITKQKHGFGLPVGAWLMGHPPLRSLALDSIELLRPRGIVNAAFIDDLVKRKLPEQPGYYGVMVWILMMLGIWLDSRKL